MALSAVVKYLLFFLVAITASSSMSRASDPDILSDFLVPANVTAGVGKFFTYSGFQSSLVDPPPLTAFEVTKATKVEFPALDGQSVSYAILRFPPSSINPLHTHPRSSELLLNLGGVLVVGFVDTAGKLYNQTLQSGEMFMFPKGLVHYQYNPDAKTMAIALSAFGSASAGTVSVPSTLFSSGIDDQILAKSFKTDLDTIQKIEAGFASKASNKIYSHVLLMVSCLLISLFLQHLF